MTRAPLSRSKVKSQGHQAALLSAALTRKASAAVSVGRYSAWESTAKLRLLGGARGAWEPTGGGEGRGHIVSPRAQLVLAASKNLLILTLTSKFFKKLPGSVFFKPTHILNQIQSCLLKMRKYGIFGTLKNCKIK